MATPIDNPFEFDHFTSKNLSPKINRSQDNCVGIYKKFGINITKLFSNPFHLPKGVSFSLSFSITALIQCSIYISNSNFLKNFISLAEMWIFHKWNVGVMIAYVLFTLFQRHPLIQWLKARSQKFPWKCNFIASFT